MSGASLEPDSAFGIAMELPEGAVPDHGLLIVSYFDAEGELRWGLASKGSAQMTTMLGLLTLATVHLASGGAE